MTTLTEGRTTFVIAHRLYTIKKADISLVLEKGKIIASGNHQELLTSNKQNKTCVHIQKMD